MIELFGTSSPTYEIRKSCKFKFSILSLFLLFPLSPPLSTILVPVLEYTFSTVVRFLSRSQLILQFYNFFLILKVDSKKNSNLL